MSEAIIIKCHIASDIYLQHFKPTVALLIQKNYGKNFNVLCRKFFSNIPNIQPNDIWCSVLNHITDILHSIGHNINEFTLIPKTISSTISSSIIQQVKRHPSRAEHHCNYWRTIVTYPLEQRTTKNMQCHGISYCNLWCCSFGTSWRTNCSFTF